MNNAKGFIVIALVLAAVAAVGEVFFVFFGGENEGPGITADSINLLPEALDVESLTAFTDRAEKYLALTPKQFEDGVDPDSVQVTPSVTPTPTF
ncbi:MAG: hypothetical protein ACOYT9_00715 [Patescibacteria group bacterium]